MQIEPIALFCVKDRDMQIKEEGSLIYSEVVLLDRGHFHHYSTLYRLRQGILKDTSTITISSHADLIMGEVQQIDKKNKQIDLTNGTQVRYRYLVAIQGELHSYEIDERRDGELLGALIALLDAIRVQAGCSAVQPASASGSSLVVSKETRYTKQDPDRLRAEEPLQQLFSLHTVAEGSSILLPTAYRFCEVQT